ncbi:cellulose synthase operon protein YhjQ/BcsQ, partial [Actinomyces oris]
MPVEMPVRQAPVPAGHRRGQPGQWEQSEETLTIPALEGLGEEAVQEPGEEAPASGVMGGSQVWDGRDVSFPPLRPSAGRPVHPGGETQTGERGTSQGRARSGCSPSESPSESPPEPASEPLWASAPVGSGRGRRAAQVLAVTGARGGLGASVLLLHLAWALGRAGRRVAMMDLDPTGGLDLLCGQSVLTGLRWADLPA